MLVWVQIWGFLIIKSVSPGQGFIVPVTTPNFAICQLARQIVLDRFLEDEDTEAEVTPCEKASVGVFLGTGEEKPKSEGKAALHTSCTNLGACQPPPEPEPTGPLGPLGPGLS